MEAIGIPRHMWGKDNQYRDQYTVLQFHRRFLLTVRIPLEDGTSKNRLLETTTTNENLALSYGNFMAKYLGGTIVHLEEC
jgi:hypothetical protein